MSKYKKVLFLFRRDLRLDDNTGLLFALEHAQKVILGFIFTPEQIEHNPYRSNRCLQFMIESLEDLEREIQIRKGKLYLFFGQSESIVAQCIENLKLDAVIVNRDYTPYSIKRDLKIEATCEKYRVAFHSFEDALIHPLDQTLKADGKPYTIFTPFYRNASHLCVETPKKNTYTNFYSLPISFAKHSILYDLVLPKRYNQQFGGRNEAIKILKNISRFSDYSQTRDFPAENSTSHLSAHLKFTTCSLREAYDAIAKSFGSKSAIIRSLYWRDFFTSIAFYFPKVFQGAFKDKFDSLDWSDDESKFKKWCNGETGFPIVDAGMREMNSTGFMHNRLRLIVASFLVKDLHINWRWGEKYFAQNLIDYDPCVNNGNWQWVASTGTDAQPYFRIFNPWSQGLKFDPDCTYIKRWVPELSSFPSRLIHSWAIHHSDSTNYPPPLVDHKIEAAISIQAYKAIA